MKKINTHQIAEEQWSSPKGKFAVAAKNISLNLGREPNSTDLLKRHPFDVEICRVPAGKSACPFHSHSAQWEFYHVISGSGVVRDMEGGTPIVAGDTFIFEPGSPHQITSDSRCRLGALRGCRQPDWRDLPLPGQRKVASPVA